MLRVAALCLLIGGVACLSVHDINSRTKAVLVPKADPKLSVLQDDTTATAQVFPVPTTAKCIVIMCIQYMIIYTALAVCRTYQEFAETGRSNVEAGLRAAAQTLTYGPMLCVLFIACRMRVEFLSDGKDQPQMWVQNCMYAVTFAVLASTLVVLFIPLVSGKPMPLKEGSCDLERPSLGDGESKVAFYALMTTRYLILLGLYGGLAGIIVGINTYMPPGESDLSKLPKPAPAVMCTMVLAVVFFATQLVIALCRTYEEFMGGVFMGSRLLLSVMNAAATAVEYAPMLAILFLSARMRALQHDGQPQVWAQNCMFMATGSMCLNALLAVLLPMLSTGTGNMEFSPRTRETNFAVPSPVLAYAFVVLRCICMVGFYGGALGVIYSIFVFEAPHGPTLPVSPAVQCVVNLTCQFFFVYLVMTVMLTVSELSEGSVQLENYSFFAGIEASKSTVAFAPMLSILFVTTRMYALLITDKKGAPQAWVQDGMFMATWSLLISFLACLVTGLVMDKVEHDDDGNIVNKFSNKYVAVAMTVLRYFSMLLLYGGIITIIVGLFVMTPETANGRGSVPVVSDAVNATPIGEAPPGPGHVAQTSGAVNEAAGHAATGR